MDGLMGKKYKIEKVEFDNTEYIEDLLNKGYRFHDRVIRMEIPLKGNKIISDSDMERLLHFPIKICDKFADDVYDLAHAAYTTDRRFHLDLHFNQTNANEVIDSYIECCKQAKMRVVRCEFKEQLLGVIVLRDNEDGTIDNVLGAVKPDMQGRMAAYSLYANTLKMLAEDGYKKYYGDVSSSNVASLNLHINLGAKAVSVIDEYIMEIE